MGVKHGLLHLVEENRLTIFVNRLVRKIFETKKGEVRGDWRKLYNEGLHYLYIHKV
jgi:hypothetical protein